MHYVLGPAIKERTGGCLVRLADDLRKCVLFFGTPSPGIEDDLEPWGTGFLVVTEDATTYLVTAAHVISDKLDCPFAVRFNDGSGGSRNYYIDEADWQFHPEDETVDVAILEIQPPGWADHCLFPQSAVMSDGKFAEKDIGPGDIIYTVGLWSYLRGKKRNKPFVHVGHIGMVPQDDKIEVKNWIPGKIGESVEVEAYLTEGEPLFGASGSPVFVRRSLSLGKGLFPRDKNAMTWNYGSVWLLGLLSDSFFKRAIIEGFGEQAIPRGVNIVVPSMKINEILNKPELKKKRADARKKKRAGELPEKLGRRSTAESSTRREDFTRLVTAATRKPAQED